MNRVSKIFSTYDRTAEMYSSPFVAPNSGVAIRGFSDAIMNSQQKSDLTQHPDDFDLYELGEFDASTGTIYVVPAEERKPVIQGKQVALMNSGNFGSS